MPMDGKPVALHAQTTHVDDDEDSSLQCVALGTGMKCLPASKLPLAHGNILHDSHAEVIALRAFNRFLLDECHRLAAYPSHRSPFLQLSPRPHPSTVHGVSLPPFTLAPGISIHLYCSEAPCGDASMELTISQQSDATPWAAPSPSPKTPTLPGRAGFADLGIVRRKPARPDAPLTLSKSCCDKLCMRQYVSALGSPATLLVHVRDAYLASVTMPESQFVAAAVERAFTTRGRLPVAVGEAMEGSAGGGYGFRPFRVQTTGVEFEWSRRAAREGDRLFSCNLSAVSTPDFTEVLINGVLQGRRPGDPKAASRISRRKMWETALAVARLDDFASGLPGALLKETYGGFKNGEKFEERRKVKEKVVNDALKGWVTNAGDDDWRLD